MFLKQGREWFVLSDKKHGTSYGDMHSLLYSRNIHRVLLLVLCAEIRVVKKVQRNCPHGALKFIQGQINKYICSCACVCVIHTVLNG